MMTLFEKFGFLLQEIIDLPGTWQEKKEMIKSHVSDDSLIQFISGFEDNEIPEDEDDEESWDDDDNDDDFFEDEEDDDNEEMLDDEDDDDDEWDNIDSEPDDWPTDGDGDTNTPTTS